MFLAIKYLKSINYFAYLSLLKLLDLVYEIVFEKLLHKNSSARILALLNAVKNNNQTEVPKKAAA